VTSKEKDPIPYASHKTLTTSHYSGALHLGIFDQPEDEKRPLRGSDQWLVTGDQ
jgi:hypothetical protein